MDVEHTFATLQHLKKRAIVPLLAHPDPKLRASVDPKLVPDLNNVQGDVIYVFPKKAENFVFFRIENVASFKNALKSFKPTSSEQVKGILIQIDSAKDFAHNAKTSVKEVAFEGYQLAFTRMGMNFLGVKQDTGDARFDNRCMGDDKTILGDQQAWDSVFNKTNVNPSNGSVKDDAGALHGVITVAANNEDDCQTATNKVCDLFGASMKVVGTLQGRTRPGENKGHEHFGFKDGISQPAIRNLVAPHPGQIQVDPGVIIMGYPGDPVYDDPKAKTKRPDWAKDGTMLVFRKLEQDVLPFEDFVSQNGPRWREFIPPGNPGPDLDTAEGKDLFSARLVGRWKSGAPLAKCPYRDNKKMAEDPEQNNDFDYTVPDSVGPSDLYCPFTIHNRKTAPRNLDPYVSRQYLESGSIVRGGLPYGPEVDEDERTAYRNKSGKNQKKRGLLFNCYAVSLDQGFVRQTIGYAGNDYFPITSLVPTKHGQDPILGSPAPAPDQAKVIEKVDIPRSNQIDMIVTDTDNKQYEVTGFVKPWSRPIVDPPGANSPFFVTSRGGEYFFVPPIKTITKWAEEPEPSASGVDILFLLDTTSSMQQYIDQVRNNLHKMCKVLAGSGKWPKDNPRFGFITFRDHDSDPVTRPYPFDSDVDAIDESLGYVVAKEGGDGPEAQSDAFADVLKAGWRTGVTRIVILITDSPPHGIGEYGDELPNGCPANHDPVALADQMAKEGITLHVLACEPTLSSEYSTPLDFYRGMTRKTGGRLCALSDANTLTDFILGSVFESNDIEGLLGEHRAHIRTQAKQGVHSDRICQDLHQQLTSAGVQVHTLDVEDIYTPSPVGDANAKVWFEAKKLDDSVRRQIREVKGFRLKTGYRKGERQEINAKQAIVNPEQVQRLVTKSLTSEE